MFSLIKLVYFKKFYFFNCNNLYKVTILIVFIFNLFVSVENQCNQFLKTARLLVVVVTHWELVCNWFKFLRYCWWIKKINTKTNKNTNQPSQPSSTNIIHPFSVSRSNNWIQYSFIVVAAVCFGGWFVDASLLVFVGLFALTGFAACSRINQPPSEMNLCAWYFLCVCVRVYMNHSFYQLK